MHAWMYGAAHPHMRMLHGVGDAVILRTCASPNGHIALRYPYTIYVYETYGCVRTMYALLQNIHSIY